MTHVHPPCGHSMLHEGRCSLVECHALSHCAAQCDSSGWFARTHAAVKPGITRRSLYGAAQLAWRYVQRPPRIHVCCRSALAERGLQSSALPLMDQCSPYQPLQSQMNQPGGWKPNLGMHADSDCTSTVVWLWTPHDLHCCYFGGPETFQVCMHRPPTASLPRVTCPHLACDTTIVHLAAPP